MEPTVRRYIVRILLLHVAFLVAVAAVIAAAGLALFASARGDAESDALERASVPVNQTKDLLESHFQTIFDTLRLADRVVEPGQSPPSLLAGTAGDALWSQLRGRVSAIVEVSAADLSLVAHRANTRLAADSPQAPLNPLDPDDPVLLLVPQSLHSSIRTEAHAHRLINEARDWLQATAEAGRPDVSSVVWIRDSGATGQQQNTPVVLAALPLPGADPATEAGTRPADTRSLLVGVVPVAYLEEAFLIPASQPDRNGMLLFDSEGRLVAGGGAGLAGRSAPELAPRHLPPSLVQYVQSTVSGGTSDTRSQFSGRVELGAISFDSSLVTARAVRAQDPRAASAAGVTTRPQEISAPESTAQGAGEATALERDRPEAQRGSRQTAMWLVALVNRDAVLAPLEQTARTAVLWAGAMVVAITAILVSSAIQLIRARSHLERLRTEMLDRELREARQIQLMWLPDDELRSTPTRQIDLAAENVPASHISGDFYNYFTLPDGRTAVVIGDVTGHGLTAAFLMATTQLLVKSTLQRLGDPGKTLEEVNNQLSRQAFAGQFVTIQLLVINTRTRELLAASAGHPPPLTCGPNGQWRALELEPQLVLGVLEESTYPTQSIPLEGCETLLMYTDGIIEVKNPAGKRFSLEQLLSGMTRQIGGRVDSAKQLVDATFQIVRDFAGDTPPEDDLTLLAIHLSRHPEAAAPADGEPAEEQASSRC